MKKYNGYLVFEKHRYYPSSMNARLTKNTPSLKSGEVAVKISCELPDELFERPQLQANITVPEASIPQSIISADVQDNIQQIVQEQLGVRINFTIEEQKKDETD